MFKPKINLCIDLFKKLNPFYSYKIQSFTYYIPSPPERNSGYREKQFDKIFYNFINQGFKILAVNTQSNNNPNGSGMWIIITAQARNSSAEKLDLSNQVDDIIKQENDDHEKEIILD